MLTTRFTVESLANLSDRPRGEQAKLCDNRVRHLEAETRLNFIELGLVVIHVERLELWRELCDDDGHAYHSLDGWILSSCPLSRSHAYDARAQLKVIQENNIPIEQIQNVPRCNLRQLTKLSSEIMRDPEVQQKAATLTEAQFNQEIRQRFPEQHVEERLPMRLYPTASQREVIDAAIAKVCELMGPMSREDALEALCVDFLDEHREEWEAGHVGHNGTQAQELTTTEAQ